MKKEDSLGDIGLGGRIILKWTTEGSCRLLSPADPYSSGGALNLETEGQILRLSGS
jgi:hypothetical protein